MIPRERIAVARVPGAEGGELRLYRRGGEHMILLGGNELMTTRSSGSEEALATMTVARLAAPAPRLLIGGYGMGFTLRAALAVLPAQAAVTVVELVPEILDWARGPMAELTGEALDDPRVRLVVGDVGAAIAAARQDFDAILLDVDNGPDGLTRAANDGLYSAAGLAAARGALAPGGVLAVWSAAPDPRFTRRLAQAGFVVEEAPVRARGGARGLRHHLWFAQRP
ncbi:spermidine synthase [Sphingomonas aracearum]|uniref:Spermidine synthase n=1 Tax=Sphingomonas aracearum TaxID=2283317 RepID=A0A369VXI6_9SPHN|nr:MnmC family methyltransferase [Sphingomonas aracearum]RDE06843.1 spermidine synthase [Sphingomonas aracearum]